METKNTGEIYASRSRSDFAEIWLGKNLSLYKLRRIQGHVTKRLLLLGGILASSCMYAASNIYDFTLNSIDGRPTPLSQFRERVVLLVNVASRCAFTPQYAGLERLYDKYRDRGFVIL